MIGMITTKINDLMMTYFYLGYGIINNVIPTGKNLKHKKNLIEEKCERGDKKPFVVSALHLSVQY